jgi:hypothetical protein
MRLLISMTIAMSVLAAPAFATSGAQLLRADQRWTQGYSWGILQGYLSLVSPSESKDDATVRTARTKCVVDSGITDLVFYNAVVSHVNRTPKDLADDSIGIVIRTLIEICDK